jgi:hypothetical protein
VKKNMNKKLITALSVPLMLLVLSMSYPVFAAGFDEFGYNYQARIFVGKADGVDRVLDEKVWGDPTYANDWLVMKWSKGWDDARFHGAPWGPDAWLTNEWNGAVPGGSGEVWHYKIIWVGKELEDSPYWREGGYPIWGEFEVIMDQGTWSDHTHEILALATPNGFGVGGP